MADIIAKLNTQYRSKDGKYQIIIRINQNKKRRFFDTNFKIYENEWDEAKGLVKNNCPHKDIINSTITGLLSKAFLYKALWTIEGREYSSNDLYEVLKKEGHIIASQKVGTGESSKPTEDTLELRLKKIEMNQKRILTMLSKLVLKKLKSKDGV